jgi:hypothetical protein
VRKDENPVTQEENHDVGLPISWRLEEAMERRRVGWESARHDEEMKANADAIEMR